VESPPRLAGVPGELNLTAVGIRFVLASGTCRTYVHPTVTEPPDRRVAVGPERGIE
jgi:hypothetical protein